jgi:predicted AlkP superfamily pyrophosphatase or phosphodiesterase
MKRFLRIAIAAIAIFLVVTVAPQRVAAQGSPTPPKVIVISLDGANATTVEQYLQSGVLPADGGLALLKNQGATASQNLTIVPSVTAPGHIAIATGSTAARNDVTANRFHLIVSNINSTVSGFAAPIGGYQLGTPPAPTTNPTAEPMWVKLRAAGKKVATATWPGSDGVNILEPTSQALVQPVSSRTVDYTVPFGAFAGVGASGFTLVRADFIAAQDPIISQLTAAGRTSFSPILQKTTPLETFTVQGISYTIQVAALDTSNDGATNYDTLVFWDTTQGIQPGPFQLPATGPAYVKASDKTSGKFYLEGSSGKAGTAYYVTFLDPILANVRIARYGTNNIPRNVTSEVLANVDDINNAVGFWAPQPDFRIPERLSPGFTNFPDSELEAAYEDQVKTFVDYQSNVGLRAIAQNPGADLVMIYIEQPDGSGHQFTLTDSRQATTFTNPATIGSAQDLQKIARYNSYRQAAYQTADAAIKRIIDTVGTTNGVPNSNIIVVSDHGMAPFHTAINLTNLLNTSGFDSTKVRAYSTGPAANIYINLQGRESGGTVSSFDYSTLQQQIVTALNNFADGNRTYNRSLGKNTRIFDIVVKRPGTDGLGQNALIGQDSGDVFAILKPGYNFDGTQSPVVLRQGDPPSTTPVFSVPNFYGGHGYRSTLPEMSAVFLAAGPSIRTGVNLERVRNIDVAPTVFKILGVTPGATVEGRAIDAILR